MKGIRERILKGLLFRMVVPVLLVTTVVGAGLYFFVLRAVSDFSERQVREALEETSRDLYNVCDRHFTELMQSGRMGSNAAVRIQRARALGAIEDFVRRNRIGCLLVDSQTQIPLLSHGVPEGREDVECRAEAKAPFMKIRCNGTLYYLTHFDFHPWHWHVDLYKDTGQYAPLMRRVRVAYMVTGFLLLLSALFLVWFFDRLVRTPIHRMIRAIRGGRSPDYQGSYELEFLSESIAGMMQSLRERTEWLERLYGIALTKRGETFFARIAEAVAHAVGLHVLIAQWHGDKGRPRLMGCSQIGGSFQSQDACLEGLPFESIQRSQEPLLIPSGALEELSAAPCLRAVSANFYLGLPIFNRQSEVIGSIHAFGQGRELNEWDMSLLKTTGQMVAAEFELIDKEKEKIAYRERMFQSQKLESLGILAGGVAHDFNNLLMGIQGRTSLLLLDLEDAPTHKEHLQAIEEYVRSATDLTRQLLGFARGGKYDVKPADMNDVLEHSADLFGRTKKEIRIQNRFQPKLWSVEIDRRQIEQVLLNLFVNAWHAMPGGGDLILQTDNLELDQAGAAQKQLRPGKYVSVSVTDTGVGMDEATMERIFDPFFTTKGMGRGTGLGLASAYGIVQNHGGRIIVQSEIGKGSTFSVLLPATREAVVEAEDAPGTPLRGTETLLLVDDEEMIREVGRKMLENLGYRVFVAGSGPEALSVCRRQHGSVQLVVLDMIMPDMSGKETFLQLKELDPDIRVLLCSGYSMGDQARSIIDQGCQGFIQKPFDLTELSRAIRTVLDGGNAAR